MKCVTSLCASGGRPSLQRSHWSGEVAAASGPGTLRVMNTLRQRGFNLLELMVGITVLGVLLGIGVPSFTQMIADESPGRAIELLWSLP